MSPRSALERRAELFGSEGVVLEQGELPPVERLRQLGIAVGVAQGGQDADGDRRAERIEPRRLTGRLRRSDGQHRPDPEGTPVQRLEEHRPGGERRRGREPDRADGVSDLRRRVGWAFASVEITTELEDAHPVRLAGEPGRKEPPRLGPMRGELLRERVAYLQSRRQLDRVRHRETDERSDGGVPAALAEERGLEPSVRALERLVVPIEAAARVRGRHEEPEEHCPEERIVLGRPGSRVGLGEDSGRRLACELLERETRVLSSTQERLTVLDERADERAQLVQCRALALDVLLEGERKVCSLLELPTEHDESAEDETTEEWVQMRSAHSHDFRYAAEAASPLRTENGAARTGEEPRVDQQLERVRLHDGLAVEPLHGEALRAATPNVRYEGMERRP